MAVHFEGLVAGFSGYHKYTLGTELRQGSRAVLQQVLRANNASTRKAAAGLESRHGGGEGVHVGADGAHSGLTLA